MSDGRATRQPRKAQLRVDLRQQPYQPLRRRAFRAGDQPSVPGASGRHAGLSREELAKGVAENALIGDPRKLADDLAAFIGATSARRLAFYMEAVGDQAATLSSIERFAGEVRPLIAAMEHLSI